ncbi:MAG: type VI secretion system baseplate subunit TssF [Bacteroidales bacterium]|jgi:hypothetical protein|nr:type VI secretion system baseplate subunit TssF [Bacteroidales bacterium]
MNRSAANIWGVRNIDNFDSVIKLLIESLASEINKLSNELENIEARLLERLAGVLTPDILTAVHPAHMIVHAKPHESFITVNKNSSFYHKNKDYGDIHFSPAGDFDLICGEVRSIICAGKIYLIDSLKSKEICAISERPSEKFTNRLWIGLHVHPDIISVRDLSFYFDLPNCEKKNELLHLLPYSLWEYGETRLDIQPGMNFREKSEEEDDSIPLASCDPANLSDESIINSYKYQYITVTGEIVNREKNLERLPKELQELFPQAENNQGLTPLLWLKITLPPGFEDYILDDFFVSINAFPVINRKKYSKYLKMNPMVSVIPFEMDKNEFFLSVDSVSDSNNCRYKHLPFKNEEQNGGKFGTYSLKRGGAERFDSRNAEEYLSNLMDVLREENASFSAFGKGYIEELVKKIDEELTLIKLKLKELHINREMPSYMVIDSNEVGGAGTVYLDYWVTNCEPANGIKPGSLLFPFNDMYLEKSSVVTLTPSQGGQQRSGNPLETYKYILTCRDRIYTEEDIINFCCSRFGDVIASATVKKGIRVSANPKEGLVRSIDVYLTLKEQVSQTDSIHQNMVSLLLSLLKSKSPETYNYRVFILNKQ